MADQRRIGASFDNVLRGRVSDLSADLDAERRRCRAVAQELKSLRTVVEERDFQLGEANHQVNDYKRELSLTEERIREVFCPHKSESLSSDAVFCADGIALQTSGRLQCVSRAARRRAAAVGTAQS